jgi:hypothetical protein
VAPGQSVLFTFHKKRFLLRVGGGEIGNQGENQTEIYSYTTANVSPLDHFASQKVLENFGSGTSSGAGESRLPVRVDVRGSADDSLTGWLAGYFAVEVTTAKSSRAVQRRDLGRFLAFMQLEEGSAGR